jgi:hypothetical protein
VKYLTQRADSSAPIRSPRVKPAASRPGPRPPNRARCRERWRTRPSSPRCCREMALERAESSGVVALARRQGVDKARKIRWLTYGRMFRPG